MSAARVEANASLAALRQTWVTYLGCVLCIALGTRILDARVSVAWHAAVHATLLLVVWLLPTDRASSRALWSSVVLIGLPTVFSAVGLLLPALHPQPYEWACIAFDRWLFGVDPTVAMQRWLTPPVVELLQLRGTLLRAA